MDKSEIHEIMQKATNALRQGNYEEAIDLYETLPDESFNKYKVLTNLGLSYFNLGDYETALEYYDKATEVNSDGVYAWINKGTVYDALKKFDKAKKCFEKALEINQNIPPLWYNLGTLHLNMYRERKQKGKQKLKQKDLLKTSLKYLDTALEMVKNDPATLTQKALVLDELGRTKEAEKCRQRVKKLTGQEINDDSKPPCDYMYA
ncbi:MAG: tetratricopeptide repeat protein [Candidatus Undinarchaeales archaeon]